MLVTIITVVYNNEELIQEAIDSVKSQDYKNIEHLIIDGGSTDRTLEIIKNNDHVKYISEKDKGLYDAMNKGAALASGDIIGLLNSDDLFKDNGVVSRVVNLFEENKAFDIVFGNLEYVKRDNPGIKVRTWVTGPHYPNFFEDGLVPPHPTVYLKRAIYKDDLFDLNYKLAADYEFMLRVFKKRNYTVGYLNAVLISMRLGGVTNKSFKNIFDQNREIKRAWKNNGFSIPFLFWVKRVWFKINQFKK